MVDVLISGCADCPCFNREYRECQLKKGGSVNLMQLHPHWCPLITAPRVLKLTQLP